MKKKSIAKPLPPKPKPGDKRKMKKSQSLFEMMKTLTAEQRQRFGEFRRKMKSDPKVKEEILWDDKLKIWYVQYSKGKKVVTKARFLPQKLEIGK